MRYDIAACWADLVAPGPAAKVVGTPQSCSAMSAEERSVNDNTETMGELDEDVRWHIGVRRANSL